MKIQLSDHFTARRLFRFVLPGVIMMIYTSVYGVVDGYFVSNYAGKTAFAGLNLIMPVIMAIGTFGFMIGTGGTALVSKTLGEGDRAKANGQFSMLVYTVIAFGVAATALAELFLPQIARLLRADDALLPYCLEYGRIGLLSVTFFMLQNVFQSFLVAAERPRLGLLVSIFAGLANMVLDYVFVGLLHWGAAGAAAATAVSEVCGGALPLLFFFSRNSSLLRLGKPRWNARDLLKACGNGASELMTNVSMSLVNMLYNSTLLRYFGEDGVAAYGIIMYVNFVFVSVFLGYSIGVAPLVGYHYGAKNRSELKNLFSKSMRFIGFAGLSMFLLAQLTAPVMARVFAGYDEALSAMTRRAFALYATAYLFKGFNIYASSFFTALSNGAVSAAISFSRSLLFQLACILLLPVLFGAQTIWISVTVAEVCTLVLSVSFLITQNKRYGYAGAPATSGAAEP